jgi:1,2-phenylacetyl-CoA epoxidase catalytic subunit
MEYYQTRWQNAVYRSYLVDGAGLMLYLELARMGVEKFIADELDNLL